MKHAAFLVCLLLSLGVQAQTVYKCETEAGVTFSSTPCADDAEEMNLRAEPPPQGGRSPSRYSGESISAERLDEAFGEPAEQVLALIGEPAARFEDDGVEHWLYPNACKRDPAPVCVEMLFEDGRSFQISWQPEDVMQRAVTAARRFADWTPPTSIERKHFHALGLDLTGQRKAQVTARLGPPDTKKVFDGAEWWEYEQVPLSPGDASTVVLYLEFDRDTVVQTTAN